MSRRPKPDADFVAEQAARMHALLRVELRYLVKEQRDAD
jgi:hypothetical protein